MDSSKSHIQYFPQNVDFSQITDARDMFANVGSKPWDYKALVCANCVFSHNERCYKTATPKQTNISICEHFEFPTQCQHCEFGKQSRNRQIYCTKSKEARFESEKCGEYVQGNPSQKAVCIQPEKV